MKSLGALSNYCENYLRRWRYSYLQTGWQSLDTMTRVRTRVCSSFRGLHLNANWFLIELALALIQQDCDLCAKKKQTRLCRFCFRKASTRNSVATKTWKRTRAEIQTETLISRTREKGEKKLPSLRSWILIHLSPFYPNDGDHASNKTKMMLFPPRVLSGLSLPIWNSKVGLDPSRERRPLANKSFEWSSRFER